MAEVDTQMEDTAPVLQGGGGGGGGGLSQQASRMFRVYKTISSMLFKRGYMVPREMREMTPASFTQKFGEHPSRESLTVLVVCLCAIFMFMLLLLLIFNGVNCSVYSYCLLLTICTVQLHEY